MRFAKKNGRPLVLRAIVSREAISLYHNKRDEYEIVVFKVPEPKVDGNPDDWEAGFICGEQKRKAERASLRERHVPR